MVAMMSSAMAQAMMLSDDHRSQEMSTMVTALAHVISQEQLPCGMATGEVLVPAAHWGTSISSPSSSSSSHSWGGQGGGSGGQKRTRDQELPPESLMSYYHGYGQFGNYHGEALPNVAGLGFLTSLVFVFLVGIFVSSWLGATVFWLGEWLIKRMPFVRHIYSASKQISTAISSDQNAAAFKEVAIIRHPRVGEYAFGFITSSVTLQSDKGDEELCSVYVPTNHLYIGDIFLVNSEEIIRPNLSIREGIEIIVSGGMTMPQMIAPLEQIPRKNQSIRLNRIP